MVRPWPFIRSKTLRASNACPYYVFCKRMTYLLWIAYKGTNYGGFQVQPNAPTVCAAVQDAMQRVLGCRPDVKGCSRTDAGVHARRFALSFCYTGKVPAEKMVQAFNAHLPPDIRALEIWPVAENFHARYAAHAKTYRYYILNARARKNGSVMYRVAAPQRYTASDFAVEGDYSQAAFLAVLGCAVGGINVVGLNPDSQQGDKVILDILKRCGGKFKPIEGGYRFERSLLKATEIDLADCPDLGPILFTLGCFCNGSTVIRNAGRLRLKESDRISAMQEELKKMGARIEVDGDTVTITGVALHAPAEPLYGHNDHRIVMALAVAVYAAGLPALLRGAEAVNKSWPAFWDTLRGLGAKIDTE